MLITELVVLISNQLPTSMVFMFGLGALYFTTVLDFNSAFNGFTSTGVMVVVFLYVLAKVIHDSRLILS